MSYLKYWTVKIRKVEVSVYYIVSSSHVMIIHIDQRSLKPLTSGVGWPKCDRNTILISKLTIMPKSEKWSPKSGRKQKENWMDPYTHTYSWRRDIDHINNCPQGTLTHIVWVGDLGETYLHRFMVHRYIHVSGSGVCTIHNVVMATNILISAGARNVTKFRFLVKHDINFISSARGAFF